MQLIREMIRWMQQWLMVLALGFVASGQYLNNNNNNVHSTRGASEKPNDLRCYTCHTMTDGNQCIDLAGNLSNPNNTYVQQCKDDKRICMVKRYSYTTSTENSTSTPQLWALERNCSSKCEAGCIIIGERTKLYACTACCEKALCNVGTGDATSVTPHTLTVAVALLALVGSCS